LTSTSTDATSNSIAKAGGFYEDRILTLQYRNTESDVRQHGIIMVQLSANGRSLLWCSFLVVERRKRP
jgi:hypothetical protein